MTTAASLSKKLVSRAKYAVPLEDKELARQTFHALMCAFESN